MARTITMPRRRKGKKTYVLKRKLQMPKVVRLGNKQLTVRYDRIGIRNLHRCVTKSSRKINYRENGLGRVYRRRRRRRRRKGWRGGGAFLASLGASLAPQMDVLDNKIKFI